MAAVAEGSEQRGQQHQAGAALGKPSSERRAGRAAALQQRGCRGPGGNGRPCLSVPSGRARLQRGCQSLHGADGLEDQRRC